MLAETMGTAAEDCVVVEDTTIGVQAAVAAGMRVIGLARHADPRPLQT
jgi:HAD superfamily hydrolase (TIGR01509 family)